MLSSRLSLRLQLYATLLASGVERMKLWLLSASGHLYLCTTKSSDCGAVPQVLYCYVYVNGAIKYTPRNAQNAFTFEREDLVERNFCSSNKSCET